MSFSQFQISNFQKFQKFEVNGSLWKVTNALWALNSGYMFF